MMTKTILKCMVRMNETIMSYLGATMTVRDPQLRNTESCKRPPIDTPTIQSPVQFQSI